MPGERTWSEIRSQPQVLKAAISEVESYLRDAERMFSAPPPREIVLTGCGSSYYLGLSAASIFSKFLRLPARAVPASEIILYPETVFARNGSTLVIGISRSGETSETVAALKVAASFAGNRIMSVSCSKDAEIAATAGFHLALADSDEASVVMTRSFTSMLLALQAIAAAIAGDSRRSRAVHQVPYIVEQVIQRNAGALEKLAADKSVARYVTLGSGPAYGIACEGALKMTEMALETAQPFYTLEFRHGPKSLVDKSTLVISIPSDALAEQETSLLEELRGFSGRIVTLGKAVSCAEVVLDVPVESLDDWDRVVAMVVPLQMLAYFKAMKKNLDPDTPKHLSQVVRIDLDVLGSSGGGPEAS